MKRKCSKCSNKVEAKYRNSEVYCHLHNQEDELYDADENCEHEIAAAGFSGVKCTKCTGWFCF